MQRPRPAAVAIVSTEEGHRSLETTDTIRELKLGDVVDEKYRVVKLLGAGGMGAVYAAERLTLGDTVAIKCILGHRNTAENRDRFLREARAAARIRHPNVVRVFDFGELDDACTPYMVMEFLEGPTLAELLQGPQPLPLEQTLALFRQVCAAVEAGHRRGVVHRDIKPGNVVLDQTDDGQQVIKVLDFGLAVLMEHPVPDATGSVLVGTVDYMPPEQIAGQPISPASDVFALGVLLYEMVTGKLPFRGRTAVLTLINISEGDHRPVSEVAANLPPELASAIEAAISVAPSDRPRSPLAFAEAAGAIAPSLGAGVPAAVVATPSAELRTDIATHPVLTDIVQDPAAASLSSPSARGLTGDVVGRSSEWAAVQDAFEAASGGRANIVLLTGEVGVGKSRLLDEVAANLEARKAEVVRGKFYAYAGDRAPPQAAFPWMLGESAWGTAIGPLAPADKWARFDETAKALAVRAEEKPLVIVVDDLQWATALELDLLSFLIRAPAPANVLVVATATPGPGDELRAFSTRHTAARELRQLVLAPFTIQETERWLQRHYHPLRILAQDVRRIQHVTSGNPLGLTELVRQLLDSGRLVQDAESWVCSDLFDVGLPDSIQALVRARLNAIDPEIIAVLEVACVVGEEFRFDTLRAAIPGTGEDDLERLLEAAVARRLLVEEPHNAGADYRFTSPALRTVLYDGLRSRARTGIHRNVVDALAKVYPKRTSQLAATLAYHYDAICDAASTLKHALYAAERSIEMHDIDVTRTVLGYAKTAVNQLLQDETPPAQRVAARFEYLGGIVDTRLGYFERASGALMRAVELATPIKELSTALDAQLGLAECRLGLGENASGAEEGRKAIEMAAALDDLGREYRARVLVAGCLGPLGKLDEGLALVQPVLESKGSRFAVPRALAQRERAWMLAKRGEFADAQVAARAALAEATAGRDAMARYRAVSALGLVQAEAGDHTDALAPLKEALELARSMSLRRREAIEGCNIAECLYLSGQAAEGLEHAQAGLKIFIEISDAASEADCRVNIGRMLRRLGRLEDAAAMLDRGREGCAAAGRREYEGIALCELAELRTEKREPILARALFEQAVERFESIGSAHLWRPLFGLAKANATLGEHERSQDQAALAQGFVRRQLDVVPDGYDTSLLRRAYAEITAFESQVPDTMETEPSAGAVTDRATLAAQHRGLEAVAVRLLRRRTPPELAEHAETAARELGELAGLLRVHARSENIGLYPHLLQHADEAVRRRASGLYSEGVGLYDDFLGFHRRYPDAASIRANVLQAHAELARVLSRLGRRMELEENELHPMAPR